MTEGPRMSVVLVTDSWSTIRGVVQRLARQTVAGDLELVLVAPSSELLEPEPADVAPLHSHRVVGVDDIYPLWLARAAGVRATSAPVVTVGETHAYARADWAAAILREFDAGRTAVVPGFTCGNPDGSISWSNLIVDYGRWSRALAPGETRVTPAYNATFTRAFLIGLGDQLDEMYAPGFDVAAAARAQGHALWHAPGAVLYHVNVSRRWGWVRERLITSRVQAAQRAEKWGRGRRVVYVAGSPLIIPLLIRRNWAGYRAAARGERLPKGTLACLVAGCVVKAAGEAVGFTLGADERHRRASDEMEVHKMRYTRHGVQALVTDDA